MEESKIIDDEEFNKAFQTYMSGISDEEFTADFQIGYDKKFMEDFSMYIDMLSDEDFIDTSIEEHFDIFCTQIKRIHEYSDISFSTR